MALTNLPAAAGCISTPTEPILPGRGFYQLEEGTLYVQVGPFTYSRRFYSYLQSDNLGLDIDRQGRLIFIEFCVPRGRWVIEPSLEPPAVAEPADIRWLDFRARIAEPICITDRHRSSLLLRFRNSRSWRNYFLAESVIAQVDGDDCLSAIWIGDIVDDLAGRKMKAFRKKVRCGEPFIEDHMVTSPATC